MTCAARLTLSELRVRDTAPEPRSASSGKVFQVTRAGFDPHRYRVLFPDRWSAYLKAHHRNPEEVAFFYDVTFRTATNWWEGIVRPTGDKVALAAIGNPDGFRTYMGEPT